MKKVCAKCFAERAQTAVACPGCGMVEEEARAAQRPRSPFGFKVKGEAPDGAEMFRGFAVTSLRAGDVIEWSYFCRRMTIKRKQVVVWFWKRARWQASISCCDLRTFWIARDIIAIVAAMGGLRAVPRSKENRRSRDVKSWILKK